MSVYPTTATAPRSRRTRRVVGLCILVAAAAIAAGLALSHRNGSVQAPAQTRTATVARPTSLMQLTPGAIAGGVLGGYAIPTAKGPTLQQVLDSMSPQTRRYTERLMSLTFQQLAAGAAGHP